MLATVVAMTSTVYTYLEASKEQRYATEVRYEKLAAKNQQLREQLNLLREKVASIEESSKRDQGYYKLLERNLEAQSELLKGSLRRRINNERMDEK